jgi:hypothetical protein
LTMNISDREFRPVQLRIHAHMLDLIARDFREHRFGLAELAKNAYHSYLEKEVDAAGRVILFLFSDGNALERREPAIAAIDFGGMTQQDLYRFAHWGDPLASGRPGETHGNGGKAYMVKGFDGHSFIATVRDGKRNVFGFEPGNVNPGHFGEPNEEMNFAEDELTVQLQRFGVDVSSIPMVALQAFRQSQAFTLVIGESPVDVVTRGRIATRALVDALSNEAQMVQVLRGASVFAIVNGRLMNDGQPISPPEITLHPGSTINEIEIPEEIPAETGAAIRTVAEGAPLGRLLLKVADSSIFRRRSVRAMHRIEYFADGAPRGFVPIRDLVGASLWTDRIFGECHLDTINPDYVGNMRAALAPAPLTRALNEWIREQIRAQATVYERLESREIAAETSAEMSRQLRDLDQWKNRFLDEARGIGSGELGGIGPRPGIPRPQLPTGEIDRIELRTSGAIAGIGVPIDFSLEFFDAGGGRVRAVPTTWHVNDDSIASVQEETHQIVTRRPGNTFMYVETQGGLRSSTVNLEVVAISEIIVPAETVTVEQSKRRQLSTEVATADGRRLQAVKLYWMSSNEEVASVGPGGMVFGVMPGTVTIHALDESNVEAEINVEVTPTTGGDGPGYPQILLSEVDRAPYDLVPPQFDPEEGPVHQRTQDTDHEIWWVNLASPVARYLYENESVSSPAWRGYLLERTAEILARILIDEKLREGELDPMSWSFEFGDVYADMHTAMAGELASWFTAGILDTESE